jgi:hypothetical protein
VLAVNTIFQDAFSGALCTSGVTMVKFPVDNHGVPSGAGQVIAASDGHEGLFLKIAANGRPVLVTQSFSRSFLGSLPQSEPGFLGNQARNWYLRLTVLEAEQFHAPPPPTIQRG